jgi:hypothetical protein
MDSYVMILVKITLETDVAGRLKRDPAVLRDHKKNPMENSVEPVPAKF